MSTMGDARKKYVGGRPKIRKEAFASFFMSGPAQHECDRDVRASSHKQRNAGHLPGVKILVCGKFNVTRAISGKACEGHARSEPHMHCSRRFLCFRRGGNVKAGTNCSMADQR